jgi:biotin synthase
MPKTIIRLAAGRHEFSETEQAMVRQLSTIIYSAEHDTQAFMAGANAIFTGEKMLTTPCSGWDEDKAMLGRWGLRGLRSFEDKESSDMPAETVRQAESGTASA